MGKAAKLNDIKKFNQLNVTYVSFFKNLFGRKTPKGTEGWEWDLARNYLAYILQYESFYSQKRIDKKEYENKTKQYWFKYLKILEGIKKEYLK